MYTFNTNNPTGFYNPNFCHIPINQFPTTKYSSPNYHHPLKPLFLATPNKYDISAQPQTNTIFKKR